MLKYLIQKGYVNVNKLFLENFCDLNLNYQELVVVLKLFEMLKKNQVTISVTQLSKKLNMKESELSSILTGLIDRDLITLNLEYTKQGKEKESFNLDNLIKHLETYFSKQIQSEKQSAEPEKLEKLRVLIEETFKRSLTPLELQIILDWETQGVTETDIRKALAIAVSKKKLNLRYVDACLIALQKEESFEIDSDDSKILNDFYRNIK